MENDTSLLVADNKESDIADTGNKTLLNIQSRTNENSLKISPHEKKKCCLYYFVKI